jgi:hypothetical protein
MLWSYNKHKRATQLVSVFRAQQTGMLASMYADYDARNTAMKALRW